MKLFVVDCVSSHRVTYVVRCEEESHALDMIASGEAGEFSQEHLGELVSRVREIPEEEYLALFDKDNDYLKSWTIDQKKALITEPFCIENVSLFDPMSQGDKNL